MSRLLTVSGVLVLLAVSALALPSDAFFASGLLVVLAGVVLVVRAGRIAVVIYPDRLEARNLVRTRTFAWSEIDHIGVGTPLSSLFQAPVVRTLVVYPQHGRLGFPLQAAAEFGSSPDASSAAWAIASAADAHGVETGAVRRRQA